MVVLTEQVLLAERVEADLFVAAHLYLHDKLLERSLQLFFALLFGV
jgi:hypothetical protein